LRDGKSVAEIAQKHDVHPNRVAEWRCQLLEPLPTCSVALRPLRRRPWTSEGAVQPALKNDLFGTCAQQGGIAERRAMIDRMHGPPIKRQAERLDIGRGTVGYRPESVSTAQLSLVRRIDELHLEHPFAGSRMMRGLLRRGTASRS
jgi:putative transposase